jgi:hypothetical protein
MLVIMFVGGMGESLAQTGTLNHSPADIVRRYLTLDSKGARLNSVSYEALSPIVGWGSDPVWGHAVVIDNFTVADDLKQWEVVSNLEVVIPVTFSVLGSVYYERASFVEERTTEEILVRVKAVRNRWRIVEPIWPPHIGQKRMINHVRQAWLDETDMQKREQLATLQEALKKAK